MLSVIRGVPKSTWRFNVAPNGKPLVRSLNGPHFNLSHCDGLVICAVSPDVEVGVDVERVTREAPLELVQTHFALEERRWLDGLPPTARQMGFLRLRTLKEAFIKAHRSRPHSASP
jgi:4'-phosphopantetheinyl transferase